MADKAKFAYGSLKNLQAAIDAGKVDAFDLLCLMDGNTPRIGWLDKDCNPVIVPLAEDEVVAVDELPETGEAGVIYIVGEIVYIWSGDKFVAISESTDMTAVKEQIATLEEKAASLEELVAALETEVDTKVDADEVVARYIPKMYEVVKTPDGTLVDYNDKEIRVMVPADTDWATQESAVSGVENMFYVENRIYALDGAVRYRVNFGGTVTEGAVEDFAGSVDEYGKIYLVAPLPVAYYDTTSAAWVYYGANSTTNHYIGWDQIVDWYDADGMMIASDSIRISLSNEDCHFEIKPFYMGEMEIEIKKYTDELIEAKIEEITEIPVVEF